MTVHPLLDWSYNASDPSVHTWKVPLEAELLVRPMYNFLVLSAEFALCLSSAQPFDLQFIQMKHSEPTTWVVFNPWSDICRNSPSHTFPDRQSTPLNSHDSASADATLTEVSADTTLKSSPCHWIRHWCIIDGTQQLAWIQSHPRSNL
jgi:hypothetical protein